MSSQCEERKRATELNQQNKWIRMNYNMQGVWKALRKMVVQATRSLQDPTEIDCDLMVD